MRCTDNQSTRLRADYVYKNLILELDAEIAIITLNRPSSRNALSLDLMSDLLDCLSGIEQNRSVRAVYWQPQGTRTVPVMT